MAIADVKTDNKIEEKEEKEESKEETEKKENVNEILRKNGYDVIEKGNMVIGKKSIHGVPFYIVIYEGNLNENTIATFLGKLSLLSITPNIRIFLAKEINGGIELLRSRGIVVIREPKELEDFLYSLSNAKEKINLLRKIIKLINVKIGEYETKVKELKDIIKQVASNWSYR